VAVYKGGRILFTASARELTSERVMEHLTGAKTDENA